MKNNYFVFYFCLKTGKHETTYMLLLSGMVFCMCFQLFRVLVPLTLIPQGAGGSYNLYAGPGALPALSPASLNILWHFLI